MNGPWLGIGAQSALDEVWARLGASPVDLRAAGRPSRTSTQGAEWEDVDGIPTMLASVRALYEPQARRVADTWGVDLSLWTQTLPDG